MSHYTLQLLADLQSAILTRWLECPPHFFEMGLPERWLDPPEGYDGPPMGFGRDDDEESPLGLPWLDDDETESTAPPPESAHVMANLDFERSISEMEQWRDEKPPERQDMFYHFGFEPVQFPPAERLSDGVKLYAAHSRHRAWVSASNSSSLSRSAGGNCTGSKPKW